MTFAPDDAFRCSLASLLDAEPVPGSAPTDRQWLFIEQPGPWTPKAADELAVPRPPGVRVQLIRRHGGGRTPNGVRVFRADVVTGTVETAVVETLGQLPSAQWRPHLQPLWLVCTHGRRDRCCAELGRPVAAALAAVRSEEVWETSHLGGHRFAPTLLALPSGVVLGHLRAADAVAVADDLAAGLLPADRAIVRGRAGVPGPVQAAEAAHRLATGERRLAALEVVEVRMDPDDAALTLVGLRDADGVRAWRVRSSAVLRRQSCGDGPPKPAPRHDAEPA